MKRLWILFRTELTAWRRDPITALGGVIPPSLILIAFSLLFGGRLSFKIAMVNQDMGPYGRILRETFDAVISPLNNVPYYNVTDLGEEQAFDAYYAYEVDGLWIIPADFSDRVERSQSPKIEMYFHNYNDDRAKNHRIYSAEVMWAFYQRIEMPAPPLALDEQYPLPTMIDWVPIIAVGVALLSACLGSIFNMYALTYKEQISGLTLEFGLAPRSLLWVWFPKIILALIFGLISGTFFLIVIYVWLGFSPRNFLLATWLLISLVCLFWIGIAAVIGMRSRNYMAGALGVVLGAIIIFFIGGGMGLIRFRAEEVLTIAWLFPNTYAIDPLRDLVLFHTWPIDWLRTWATLGGFALISLSAGLSLSSRNMRRLG
jgi:ABC-type multidrug transport system permease subunit